MRIVAILIVLSLGLISTNASAQKNKGKNKSAGNDYELEKQIEPTGDEARADRLFFNENYEAALEEYLLVLKKKPEDIKINYNIALCYLNSDFQKPEAIPYLEKVLFYDEEAATVYFLMGKAYQAAMKFDRAIYMFNKYIEYFGMGAEFSIEEAQLEIEYCENAYELMKFPVGCTYENLGPSINSPYPDYFPFVTIDERFMVFTTKRDDGSKVLPDGTYASNIYYTYVEDGEYVDAIPMPGANNDPAESEVVIGMSNDGSKILLMRGLEGISGDIYEADFKDGKLQNIKALDEKINSPKYREIAATYGVDENTIYFVSDRPGGYGGTDIWVVKKLPTGAWGVPFNAGPDVNTYLDEDFPNISPDGKYMFFSSKGHFSMGGYDIFKAEWNPDSNRYVNPRNIGYPVNSVDDDMNYRLSKSGRYGYISALRQDGYGDYDIYRLTITEVESEYSVLKGVISSADGLPVNNVSITVSDLKTGDLFGVYQPNPNTMRYVIILPPGEFDVFIESPDFEPAAFEVKVLGKSSFKPEIDRDIVLIPK
ncbi:MAG: hypothetical protein Kow0075_12670 [Salibacteraceae bacterium]